MVALLLVLGSGVGRVHSTTLAEQSARQWAVNYGLDPDWFWSIALCESSGNAGAYNAASGASGLMQWKPESYQLALTILNNDTTLAPHLISYDPESRSYWDGDAAAHVAAYMMWRGYSYWWECA